MRKSGDWMTIWDDRILEYVFENGSGSPTQIAKSDYIHVSKQHISRRLRELADHGLLNPLGNGVYEINTTGWYYLEGGYDAESGEFMHNVDPEHGIENYKRPVMWTKDKINKLSSKFRDDDQ